MRKRFAIALASAACALASTGAHAGNVYWSIGISTPPIGTVISNAPVYAPAPVVYAPAPVVYAPPPPRVVYRPVPVVVGAPVYYRTAPAVVYGKGYYRRGYDGHHHHDEYGEYHDDSRWQPVPADPRRRHHER